MDDIMSDREFAAQLDYEGVEYALLEYGLGSENLEPGSVFTESVKKFESVKSTVKEALKEITSLMDKVLAEGEDYE